MSNETVADAPQEPAAKRRPALLWGVMGATALVCLAVIARVPLWGALAWGVHEAPDFVGNAGLLLALALVFGAHERWMRASAETARKTGLRRVVILGALMLALGLSARLGENAGWGRFSLVTANPAAGGFFEAAYDSRDNSNWLRDYPDLMKRYHHVHSHPPAPVAAMRWMLQRRSTSMTGGADALLALSPGVNSQALAQFASNIWKRPYTADDIAAAFWGGILWLGCALLVPGAIYVADAALFGPRAATHGALLACVVPSFLMFVPGADLSYLTCAALALALAAVGSQKFAQTPKIAALYLALGGGGAAVGVTGSFAGAWAIVLTAVFLVWRAPLRRAGLAQAGIFVGAATLVLGAFQLLGVNWLLFWRSVIAFNVDADVPPVLRFVYHLADFFVFLGVPISIVLLWGVARALRNKGAAISLLETEAEVVAARAERRDVLALAVPTLATLLVLNTVISMAETARIWMLFMPQLLVAVGAILARTGASTGASTGEPTDDSTGAALVARWVLVAQLVQTWIFVVFLNVWSF